MAKIHKYFPPIHINWIRCEKDKTQVKVSFYEVDEKKAADKIKKGENVGGTVARTEIFTLEGGLTEEQARKKVYAQLVKDKVIKRKQYERD